MIVSHVGDSRIYLLSHGRFNQLTEDHTLINEYLQGHREAEEPPAKHILTKSIGSFVDMEPTIEVCPYKKGDLFLMCSDGLSNSLSNDEIADVLSGGGECQEMGKCLIQQALTQGGSDNITVVVVKVGDDLPR